MFAGTILAERVLPFRKNNSHYLIQPIENEYSSKVIPLRV